ncbi:Gfo/Idh/MocA family protein [Aerococcus kribbianus]|uniref:Gfo/Idh/MocA family oxidoreductase n=1 Tax=Aerococcus kribbianus TaxID=2999064 RepID=A0A9X3JDC5_9LACT|nr:MULTISPECIES: Gfo/Idh/MocA family oxidoreductase [unclassified Aerococcus]MCZ0717350.1 Gfo/Idh/MocA family oxidoreductase [Aerococcus sp. YH-aer221]MCZ0725638.1 Gfo/Idh/MocA family oxidoreductase [Aerococcus sp. YH-aer222]
MNKLRLGIIGYGQQGGFYGDLLAKGQVSNMEVGAVTEIDSAKDARIKEVHPEVTIYRDYKEMVKSGDVDAIITTVPHYLHPEMAMFALENGIHVLNEKPAGVYTKQVKELNDFASKHDDLTYAIMFNQRNNPLYKRIKEIVDNGEIGDIRRTNWIITTWWRPQAYYDMSDWRATWGGEGGGVLVNQAPHQLDLIQWIAGVPEAVYGKVKYGYQRDIVVEDEVTAVLDYGNGATGTFVTCTHDLIGTDRLEILGDKGKIVVEDSQKVKVYRMTKSENDLNKEMDFEGVKSLFMGQMDINEIYQVEEFSAESQWGGQHAGVLENFAAHILDGEPLLAPGSEGINGVRLANAIHLSDWTNQEVSLVDFDDNQYLEELNKRIAEEGKYETR